MKQFGPYKLVRLLGTGGMGQVFEALRGTNPQPIAIKVIRGPQAISEDARVRFIREARAAGQLKHPKIVAVYDIGQVGGTLYMEMECLQGVPLSKYIPGPPILSLKSKLSVMAQTAEALGYAHSKGVVHRDVKPANIFITSHESVKVVDFGLAELAGLPNSVVLGGGTIPYMSPEQLAGQNLDGSSDIRSAGITLFELLTGLLPYRSLHEINTAPPPELPKEFPFAGDIKAILARSLAKDRPRRYSKAEHLGADLRKLHDRCEEKRNGDTAALFATSFGGTTWVPAVKQGSAAVESVPAKPVRRRSSLLFESLQFTGNYTTPDLNFRRPLEGVLETTVGLFGWSRKKRELLGSREKVGLFAMFHPWLLYFYLWPFGLFLWLILSAGIRICAAFEVVEHLPQCRDCRMRLALTACWTRLYKSREEMAFGYRDCMAALKHHLWQDAAKLLSIYGTEHQSEYGIRLITPAKYKIAFFECTLCGHHAARLTTDVMIEGEWYEQTKFDEVYCGNSKSRLFRAAIWARTIQAVRIAPELLRAVFEVKRPGPLATGAGALFVLLLVVSLSARLLFTRGETSSGQPKPAALEPGGTRNRQLPSSQRPWIRVEVGNFQFTALRPIHVEITIRNIGASSAKNALAEIVVTKLSNGASLHLNDSHRAPTIAKQTQIFPGSTLRVAASSLRKVEGIEQIEVPMSVSDIWELGSGNSYALVYGVVSYDDAQNVNHWVKFCSFSSQSGKPSGTKKCNDYNEIDAN
jgi:hypothetical protein